MIRLHAVYNAVKTFATVVVCAGFGFLPHLATHVQAPHPVAARTAVTSVCVGDVRHYIQSVDGETVRGAYPDPTCPAFTD